MRSAAEIISSAIESNNVPAIYDGTAALLNLRQTLIAQKDSSQLPEINALERTIGELLVYIGDWNGIDAVAAKLLLMGAIPSRGDILRLAAPIYDRLDANEFESRVPLIGIVGRISSGKGTVGNIISDMTGSYHMPLSDRLREYAVTHGHVKSASRDTLRQVNDELKPRFGNQVFVDWTIKLARQLSQRYQFPLVTIDGFRSVEETQFFIDQGGVVIGITASDDVRFSRLLQRNREADDFNEKAFLESDRKERAWIDPIFAMIPPERVIVNDGSYEDLVKSTSQVFSNAANEIYLA